MSRVSWVSLGQHALGYARRMTKHLCLHYCSEGTLTHLPQCLQHMGLNGEPETSSSFELKIASCPSPSLKLLLPSGVTRASRIALPWDGLQTFKNNYHVPSKPNARIPSIILPLA